LPVSV
jgi:hypothetical protein